MHAVLSFVNRICPIWFFQSTAAVDTLHPKKDDAIAVIYDVFNFEIAMRCSAPLTAIPSEHARVKVLHAAGFSDSGGQGTPHGAF